MPAPTKHREWPLGCLRSCHGAGRTVVLLDLSSGFTNGNAEWRKLTTRLSAVDQTRRYGVFAFPKANADFNNGSFTLNPAPGAATKAQAFDTYDAAEVIYTSLSNSDAGKPGLKRSTAADNRIGKED